MTRAAFALAMVLVACSGGESLETRREAVVAGTTTTGDPAVVALLRFGALSCTGTLIAPRVVLTAAHCGIDRTTYFHHQAALGPTLDGERIAIVDARVHPEWSPSTFANDVALVHLERAPGVAPVPRAKTAVALGGATARVVGYGITRSGATDGGVKREGTVKIADVLAAEMSIVPSPSQPCNHDSGGPLFATVEGLETLVGVVSRGDAGCRERAFAARVDAHDAFITEYLERVAPGAADLGNRCLHETHCKRGDCIAALDDPRIRYCAEPCGASCAPGTTCVEGHCRKPTPTPGAIGASCSDASQCVDGECIAIDGAKICSARCIATAASKCPPTHPCRHLAGQGWYCAPAHSDPPQDGGCAIASRGGDGTWLVCLLFALARLARRSRVSAW